MFKDLQFRTHTGKTVTGERLKAALAKVADFWADNAHAVRIVLNPGRIAYYVRMGEHGEADLTYYWRLRNPVNAANAANLKALDMAQEFAAWYQAHKCEANETLKTIKRDSPAMRTAREKP